MSTVEDDNYNISSFDRGDLLTRRDPANRLGLAIQQRGGCHTFSMLVTPALSLRASKIDGRNLVFLVPVLLGQRQGSRISCKLCGAWHVLRMGVPFCELSSHLNNMRWQVVGRPQVFTCYHYRERLGRRSTPIVMGWLAAEYRHVRCIHRGSVEGGG